LNPSPNDEIRLSIGAFGTSPIDKILNYAGEIPFQLQRDKGTIDYIIKRKSTTNYIGYKTIFNNHVMPPTNIKKQKH